jgi:putative resolvase
MAKQEQKFFRLSQAAHKLGLHPITVRRWMKAGRMHIIQVGREVHIPRADIEKIVGTLDGRLVVLSARVSGPGHKADLETQIERLQVWAASERKGAELLVLSDSGSGLKASRRQVQRLLKPVCEDNVAEGAMTYENRVTRFGQAHLETLFACFGVTLTALESGESKTPEQELTDDLLALSASFSGRLSGCAPTRKRRWCNARTPYSPTPNLRCVLP